MCAATCTSCFVAIRLKLEMEESRAPPPIGAIVFHDLERHGYILPESMKFLASRMDVWNEGKSRFRGMDVCGFNVKLRCASELERDGDWALVFESIREKEGIKGHWMVRIKVETSEKPFLYTIGESKTRMKKLFAESVIVDGSESLADEWGPPTSMVTNGGCGVWTLINVRKHFGDEPSAVRIMFWISEQLIKMP